MSAFSLSFCFNHIVSRIASIFLIRRIFDVTGCSSIPLTNSSLEKTIVNHQVYWDVKNQTWWARRPCSCLQSWTSRPSLSPGQPGVRAGVYFCSSRLLCVVNSLQHFDCLNKKSCRHYSKIETLCPFPSPISMNTDIMFRSSSIVMTCFKLWLVKYWSGGTYIICHWFYHQTHQSSHLSWNGHLIWSPTSKPYLE